MGTPAISAVCGLVVVINAAFLVNDVLRIKLHKQSGRGTLYV